MGKDIADLPCAMKDPHETQQISRDFINSLVEELHAMVCAQKGIASRDKLFFEVKNNTAITVGEFQSLRLSITSNLLNKPNGYSIAFGDSSDTKPFITRRRTYFAQRSWPIEPEELAAVKLILKSHQDKLNLDLNKSQNIITENPQRLRPMLPSERINSSNNPNVFGIAAGFLLGAIVGAVIGYVVMHFLIAAVVLALLGGGIGGLISYSAYKCLQRQPSPALI